MDAVGVDQAVLVSLSLGANWSLILAAFHPERVAGAAFIGPATPFGPALVERALHAFDERARHRRGLGQVQRALLAARLRGLPRVLLLAGVQRAALHQADRGLRRLGPGDHARDADRHDPRDAAAGTPRGDPRVAREPVRGRALPGAGDLRRRGRHHAAGVGDRAGRAHQRHLRQPRRLRSPPARPRPGAGEPAPAAVRRVDPSTGAAPSGGCAASRDPSARSTSPRRSGWATRSATSPSPTSCASCIPTSRSTGSPSTR